MPSKEQLILLSYYHICFSEFRWHKLIHLGGAVIEEVHAIILLSYLALGLPPFPKDKLIQFSNYPIWSWGSDRINFPFGKV